MKVIVVIVVAMMDINDLRLSQRNIYWTWGGTADTQWKVKYIQCDAMRCDNGVLGTRTAIE